MMIWAFHFRFMGLIQQRAGLPSRSCGGRPQGSGLALVDDLVLRARHILPGRMFQALNPTGRYVTKALDLFILPSFKTACAVVVVAVCGDGILLVVRQQMET
jgi:hypothetical protein